MNSEKPPFKILFVIPDGIYIVCKGHQVMPLTIFLEWPEIWPADER
jgi:hypothetical protein